MKKKRKYYKVQEYIKKNIQQGIYPIGSYLPSENDICKQFDITRTTARKALDELLKDGFIEKEHGKGSKVLERSKSLGLLTVKGFTEAANHKIKTVMLQEPKIDNWSPSIAFPLKQDEIQAKCVYFQRVRYINDKPIMLEHNWYAEDALELIKPDDFIEGSFFKTLSQKYFIEIKGSKQELRAEPANKEVANNLGLEEGEAVLHISICFKTSNPTLNLYSELYCNTSEFPIRNSYFL